jgi:pimeloyl-ACP methyl ester carboxylesterase
MPQYLADLEALVDTVAPGQQVIFLAHSWGAAYASWYIGHHPDRVRAAVLIDPEAITHALYLAHGFAADVDPFAEWVSDPLLQREIVSPDDHARADLLITATQLRTRVPRLGNHVDTPLFRPGCAVFLALDYQWFLINDYDFSVGLATYPGRVRILAGTDDHVLGAVFQQQQVPLFAHADLVPLPGDGHNDPMTRSAPRTVALIRSFLDEVEAVQP